MRTIYTEDIVRYDLDGYQNWLLTKKQVTEREKNVQYKSTVKDHHLDPERAKQLHDQIFIHNQYWRQATKDEAEFFPIWRADSYKREKARFTDKKQGNIHPLEEIVQGEINRIIGMLFGADQPLLEAIILEEVTDQYYDLALMMGKIDYLRDIFKRVPEIQGDNFTSAINACFESAMDFKVIVSDGKVTKNKVALQAIIHWFSALYGFDSSGLKTGLFEKLEITDTSGFNKEFSTLNPTFNRLAQKTGKEYTLKTHSDGTRSLILT